MGLFPDDKRTYAWKAIKAILRSSPYLSKVKTFCFFEGQDSDLFEPTPDSCPYLQAVPLGGPTKVEYETLSRVAMNVGFRIATGGTNIEDMMNFWGAIEDALGRFAPSPTPTEDVFRHLQNASENPNEGVVSYAFVSDLFRTTVPKLNEPRMCRGEGSLQIVLYKPI